ncbi:MAG TPA: signal peptidase I [Armatimonadetes bacterium]|nr:signal peptidase I [Armatimonadota bacterium]
MERWLDDSNSLRLVIALVIGLGVLRLLLSIRGERYQQKLKVVLSVIGQVWTYLTKEETTGEDVHRSLVEFVDAGLQALALVFLIIRPFIVQAFYIPSGSMEPTLHGSHSTWRNGPNDRILVNKFIYHFRPPQRQDIIVFKAPPSVSSERKDFIKRLIGLPGDKIEVKNGRVYVNDEPLEEPYVMEPPNYYYPPVIVPEGCYFVLGDNRNDSNDSHAWLNPFLPAKNVLGKAMVIFWPPSRIRLLK